MKVAVVTPTIGNKHLTECISSVDKQTYADLVHYIFIDGKQYESNVNKQLIGYSKTKTVNLEDNIGNGWYGHRVYASCSFLVNSDIICYLDEDNWYDSHHVENLVEKIKSGNDWAYSLRKIYDKNGNYLCDDNCESLGKWPVYFNNEVFHIDTSSFAIRRDVAVRIGHVWYGQWGADRKFFQALKNNFPKYDCTNSHTLNYRLDGNSNSVSKDFFDDGNKIMKEIHGVNFPWLQKQKYTEKIKIGPGITLVT